MKHKIALTLTLITSALFSTMLSSNNTNSKNPFVRDVLVLKESASNVLEKSTINKIRPVTDTSKEDEKFVSNITIDSLNKTFNRNSKYKGKYGKYSTDDLGTSNYNSNTNYSEKSRFIIDYNPNNIDEYKKVTINIKSFGYELMSDGIWKNQNLKNDNGQVMAEFDLTNANWNEDWQMRIDLNTIANFKSRGGDTSNGRLYWAWSTFKRQEAKYYLYLEHNAPLDQLEVKPVTEHNEAKYFGKRYTDLQEIQMEAIFSKEEKPYFSLDSMDPIKYDNIVKNIGFEYPILPNGTTFEDIAYLIRMNWAEEYKVPWKYVDLVFKDNKGNIVWDETMPNRVAKNEDGPLTYLRADFRTNEKSVEAGVIKNQTTEEGIGKENLQITLLIIQGETSWSAHKIDDAADTDLAQYLNNNTNKFINGNQNEIYWDEPDNKRKARTNNDMIFALSEDALNPLIKEVRLDGNTIAPDTSESLQEWKFPLIKDTKKPELITSSKIEIDWQDIYNGAPNTTIQTIELNSTKKELTDDIDIDKNNAQRVEEYVGLVPVIEEGNVFVELIDVINYTSNIYAILDFSDSINGGDGKVENFTNVVTSTENNMDDLKEKGFYDEDDGGVWINQLPNKNKVSLPHGEWRFETEDKFGNRRKKLFISNSSMDQDVYEAPINFFEANSNDFEEDIGFDAWKFKIDDTLKSYLVNDEAWLANYRLDFLYKKNYEDLKSYEINALIKLMAIKDGEIPILKSIVKETSSPWIIIGGIFAGIFGITILGGLIYRLNYKKIKS